MAKLAVDSGTYETRTCPVESRLAVIYASTGLSSAVPCFYGHALRDKGV